MSSFDPNDPRPLLKTADRSRSLTADEESRILQRLAARATTTSRTDLSEVLEFHSTKPDVSRPRRLAPLLALTGACASIVAVLGLLSLRDATAPDPASTPTLAPVADSEEDSFCSDHIGVIANALTRWRGVENWAWANGDPDLGQLIDNALAAAADTATEDAGPATTAADALELLRSDLAQIDESTLTHRGRIEPTVTAIDEALESLSTFARSYAPTCDTERLTATY